MSHGGVQRWHQAVSHGVQAMSRIQANRCNPRMDGQWPAGAVQLATLAAVVEGPWAGNGLGDALARAQSGQSTPTGTRQM